MSIHCEDDFVQRFIQASLKLVGHFAFDVLRNGGHPFRVHIESVRNKGLYVQVTKLIETESGQTSYGQTLRFGPLQEPDSLWFGSGSYDNVSDRTFTHFVGNTFAFQKKSEVIVVATLVESFNLKSGESIQRYVSTVGNSAVPYGYIQTNRGIYVLESFNCATGFVKNAKPDTPTDETYMCYEGTQLQPLVTKTLMKPSE